MMMTDLLQEMAKKRQEMLSPTSDTTPDTLGGLRGMPAFTPPWTSQPPRERQSNLPTLMSLAAALQQRNNSVNVSVSGGGVDPGFTSGGDNPWGIDPNGMDLVSRHGVTLDEDAMATLIAARRAGYNAFPYIGGGYRDPAVSDAWHAARYDDNGNLIPGNLPAAPGGHSMHNFGLAFDAGNLPQRIAEYLFGLGWYNGASWGDPPHYSYGRNG